MKYQVVKIQYNVKQVVAVFKDITKAIEYAKVKMHVSKKIKLNCVAFYRIEVI